ncbi:MAG: histidine phosphatase family protein, partial [Planctomycetota bacterium]
ERAAALRDLVAHAGVTHLFSSDYKRTKNTLAPLAESTGLEIEIRQPHAFAEVAAELWALPPGSVAVVSGHSNTTPGLVRALGGVPTGLESDAPDAKLGEKDYDRLYLVTLAGAEKPSVGTIELRYGRVSD